MKENQKKCPLCGNDIKEGQTKCEVCGVDLEEKTSDVVKKIYEFKNEDYSVLKRREVSENNSNSFIGYFFTSLLTIVITLIFVFIYCNYFWEQGESTTKLEKDVTITDEGIADAVEKIYDAVVVIENYVDGSLYSTGTGFVYKKENEKAYILTNHHVIDNNNEVYVVFTNDKKLKVDVVGSDEYSDIAVLSLADEEFIKTAIIGSSDELRVGDTTFAVGAPLDASAYSWTVTRGILSGKNRLVEVSTTASNANDYVMEVLQTDAAINSGNSGGPLCNSNGEVIGVTNMKIASSSVEGMGFAIPIETAIEYADKYINGEEIARPYLGVSMYDVINRRDNINGIYIESVEINSPAYKAGLKKGDVIVAINDVKVETSAYLKYELYKYSVNEKIVISYYRDEKLQKSTITLGKLN